MVLTDTLGKGVCSQCLSSKGTEEDILMLQCSLCSCFIHTSCLRVEDPPFTTLAGDNFFDLVCSDCSRSDDGFDIVRRGRMKVHVAILLALYNLHKNTPRPSQEGFYHWRDDIFSYINRHHHLFFPLEQSRIVPASFCATMTKFPHWIESGNSNPMIKGRGFYRLVAVKPPAVLLLMQSGGSAVGGIATTAQRPFKRGGTLSRPSRLRSPRTRQNVRDLANAVEKVEEPSGSSPSTCVLASTSPFSSGITVVGDATPMSSEDEGEVLARKRDFEGFDGLSRNCVAPSASARQSRDKQSKDSPKHSSGSRLRNRPDSSGSGAPIGSSSSPRTRFSPRNNVDNSSPMESNFKWFDNISSDPQLDKNLDMIFSDDFLSIANVEEVVESPAHDLVSNSGSPGDGSISDPGNHQDNIDSWNGASTSGLNMEPPENNFKYEGDFGNERRNGHNVLHGDALRNSLSSSQAKKMGKSRSRGAGFMSPPSSTERMRKKRFLAEAAFDPAAASSSESRGRPPPSASQQNDTSVPYKRHKLALTFRPKQEPFVLDKQYKEDMQYIESITPKNLHEEVQLLKRLDILYKQYGSDKYPPSLLLLRRKLRVRKEQREHGIGVFNPPAEVKSLQERGRCLNNRERIDLGNTNKFGVTGYPLLDRFLKIEAEQERVWPPDIAYRERLLGTDIRNIKPFNSPYSGKLLQPYYLQLKEFPKPLKLLLNEEIKIHAVIGELTKAYNPIPPPEGSSPIAPPTNVIKSRLRQILGAPFHYAPVRSEHIPQMNALARQCFWPGISLSEVLKYPEFTCVALYKFLVIGFGVAVPNSGICGEETYLSFLAVHPEWRRSRIASTIMYCLCEEISTDITLHVSPSNSAMTLYQRFGFKSEEMIKNFYVKYLPDDHPDNKNAFFMRRRRIM